MLSHAGPTEHLRATAANVSLGVQLCTLTFSVRVDLNRMWERIERGGCPLQPTRKSKLSPSKLTRAYLTTQHATNLNVQYFFKRRISAPRVTDHEKMCAVHVSQYLRTICKVNILINTASYETEVRLQ